MEGSISQAANSPSRILLAEDNDAGALVVEEALRPHRIDFELVRAKDGEHAIDLHFPKRGGLEIIHGLEIIQKIRTGLRCREIPMVGLSVSGAPKDRDAVRKHSAIFFRTPGGLDSKLALGAVVQEAVSSQGARGVADAE